jgi:hypothetical protein
MDRMPPTLLSIPGENQRQGEREKKEIEHYEERSVTRRVHERERRGGDREGGGQRD